MHGRPFRVHRATTAVALLLALLLAACSPTRHQDPLLTGQPLWGMGRAQNDEAESITIHEDTVLIVRYNGGHWMLDAIAAATGQRRWTHRIRSFRAPGFSGGRAETGPVVVGSGTNSLALVKDFSMCDQLGNCSERWRRYGITALKVADGTVAWSTMTHDPPADLPRTMPRHLVDARLVGADDEVALFSELIGDPGVPGQPDDATGPTDGTGPSVRPAGLTAVDARTGARLWTKADLHGSHLAGATVIANEVTGLDERRVPRYTGTIVGLDARSGAERWRSADTELVAAGGSHSLVLAQDLASLDDPSPQWTLLSVGDGTVSRAKDELGTCQAAQELIACERETTVTVLTGNDADDETREFTSIGPQLGTPVNDSLIPLVADYHRGALTGSYAIDADATVWEGELPGRLLTLSDRYAVVDVSYTDTWSDRIAVYEVKR